MNGKHNKQRRNVKVLPVTNTGQIIQVIVPRPIFPKKNNIDFSYHITHSKIQILKRELDLYHSGVTTVKI